MADQESTGIATKVVGLYRKLVSALDILATAEEEGSDSGDGEGATTYLVTRIRDLGAELERLLDEDSASGDGDYGDRAARVRTIEREIATLLPRVQTLERQQPTSRSNGWSY